MTPTNPQKCTPVYEEWLKNLQEVDGEDGARMVDTYTESDWRELRSDFVKDDGLSNSEADSVIAALRKELKTSATASPAPTAEAPITPEVMDGDWIPDPEMPGYAIDAHNRLMDIAGGKGRKIGRILTLVQTWVPRGKGPGKTHQFRMYYQITLAGKRKKVPLYQVGIRRNRLARAKAGGYPG